jgi:hypothetical protein
MTAVDDSRGEPVVDVGGDAVLSIPDRKPESVHEGVPLSDLRRQARQAYRDSLAAGAGLSGKALGELFGRSERWGRERIAETRPTLPPLDQCHLDGKGGGPGTAAASESAWRPHVVDLADTAGAATPVPEGARFVAWLGFVFGSVMSVAANVLHAWLPADERPAGWSPGIAPQVGSAVWPIGLLLSVEVLSRVPWAPGFWWALARYGGAGTVAVGSAIISYGHVHEVLLAWSYGPLGAAVGPLVLDGLMVVSGFALLTMSRTQAGTAGFVTVDLAAEAGEADE